MPQKEDKKKKKESKKNLTRIKPDLTKRREKDLKKNLYKDAMGIEKIAP